MSDEPSTERIPVPRRRDGDYTDEAAAERRGFVAERTGTELSHVGEYSFDPGVLPGNVENFLGVAQVPIGLAGPVRILGEHARGDFYVPLATTEGTLVASYSRGMRLLSECGGVKTTVVRHGTGKAEKFAEIVAATVLAGETSLSCAMLAGDWVTSHDQLGRNRP